MTAITNGGKDAAGKGKQLATQINNVFAGKGGKPKAGGKFGKGY